jgi:hypothetical protein
MSNVEEGAAEEFWEELEDRFSATLRPSCGLNKERKALKYRRGVEMPRSKRHRVREPCPGMFQDDQVWTDAGSGCELPPSGPVVIGMEELMAISERKRLMPRLAGHRIHVTGRRMEKFVPPVWKPRKKWVSDRKSLLIPEAPKEIVSSLAGAGDSSSNGGTRSNLQGAPSQVEEVGLSGVRAEEEFYQQLWVCPARTGTRVRDNPPTLVWVRKDLVDQRKFIEGDCYPLLDGDTPSLVRECSLKGTWWRGERKPSILQI